MSILAIICIFMLGLGILLETQYSYIKIKLFVSTCFAVRFIISDDIALEHIKSRQMP